MEWSGLRLSSLVGISAVVSLSAACRSGNVGFDGGYRWDTGRDSRPHDGNSDGRPDGHADGDVNPDPCGRQSCGSTELCGPDGRGDGLDNNCNDRVDEECPCQAYVDSMSCFPGDPALLNVGVCSAGVQTCSEFGTWSPCVGHVSPSEEVCDGMDNDCDGSVDEDLAGCESAMLCPGGQAVAPLSSLALRGSDIYSGAVASWHWEVTCPATVPEDSCPQPASPTAQDTEVYFIASGTYRVTVTVVTPEGQTFVCSFAAYVEGGGLRVELTWDTQGTGRGDTDVDLHLHRPGMASDWFTADDCYFSNCKASSYIFDDTGPGTTWGLPPTDVSGCSDAPHGHGAQWQEIGHCYNPRLDVDVINCDPAVTDATSDSFCAPENINIDNPPQGDVYRILVNYYSAHGHAGVTNATVNVYCGGELRASFRTHDDVVLRDGSGSGGSNDNWHVADVRITTDECGLMSCDVAALDEIIQGVDFGAPWSSF
jgi:hypothetical protein